MSSAPPIDLAELLTRLRPRLHRYCARMTGSVLDGEDVVQDALLRAAQAFDAQAVQHAEGWLFRVAHNAAMDFLRRRGRDQSLFAPLEEDTDDEAAADSAERHLIARMGLRHFMRLPASQRGAAILADVLGYSDQEAAQVMDLSLPAFKAALHRGRARLREIATAADDALPPPPLSIDDQALLSQYAQRFNERDFDGLRDLLAEHARLDLPGRTTREGRKAVGEYFTQYAARKSGLRVRPIQVEGLPALWAEEDGAAPFFVVLQWQAGRLAVIRDFYFARYAAESLTIR
jgi:RNA polymerase sigma-70 factor (ECF subfamily)